MIINNLLAFGRSSEERGVVALFAAVSGLIITACIIKICSIWERRALAARTDYVSTVNSYGSMTIETRVNNFREDQNTMPPATQPETSMFLS